MEKEMLQNFNLYERAVIKIHKKIFNKYKVINRITLINNILK